MLTWEWWVDGEPVGKPLITDPPFFFVLLHLSLSPIGFELKEKPKWARLVGMSSVGFSAAGIYVQQKRLEEKLKKNGEKESTEERGCNAKGKHPGNLFNAGKKIHPSGVSGPAKSSGGAGNSVE
ncbi:hypothetical protein ACLOJK_016127 [Asimina triloba]